MSNIELVEVIDHVDLIEINEVLEVIDVSGGPVGPPGGGSGYQHTQTASTDTWTVTHNLGYRPAGIQLWDSAGSSWTGLIVEHLDTNTLRISLPFSFGGYSIHS